MNKISDRIEELLKDPKYSKMIGKQFAIEDKAFNSSNIEFCNFGKVISCQLLLEYLAEKFIAEFIGNCAFDNLGVNTSKILQFASELPVEINLFKGFRKQIEEVGRLRNYYAHRVLKQSAKKQHVQNIRSFIKKICPSNSLPSLTDENFVVLFTKIFADVYLRIEIIRKEKKTLERTLSKLQKTR